MVDAGALDGAVPDASTDAGCAPSAQRCEATFTMPAQGQGSVELRGNFWPTAWSRGVPMVLDGGVWQVTVAVPTGADVWYKFVLDGGAWVTDITAPETTDSSGNRVNLRSAAQVQCAAPSCSTTFDWRDAVIYFVFVDRFFDGDPSNNCHLAQTDTAGDYRGGDWKGITSKINDGYFNELGVNTLWLTVPAQNATVVGRGADQHWYSAYHGYWPTELDQAEACFGTKQDLVTLVDTAHAHGLKVLLDWAMVHVHSTSSLYAQHPDWFWPNAFNGGDCLCGGNCDWNAQGDRCWFTDYLPHWNYTVAAAREASVDSALRWVKDTNVDGLRLDAIKHVDASWLLSLRQRLTAEVLPTKALDGRFYLVGETFDFSNRDYIKSFVDPQTKLDGQFDFPLRLNVLKAVVMRQPQYGLTQLAAFFDSNDDFYGQNAVMSTWLGNHDLGRVIHMAEDTPRWGEYDNGQNLAWANQPTLPTSRRPFERLANGVAVLLTNRGAPLIYYGDEIGLPGGGDPDNRRMMAFTGLTDDQQWLKQRIATLLKLRLAHPALREGQRTTLSVAPDSWAWSMKAGADVVVMALNRSDVDTTIGGLPRGELLDLIDGTTVTGPVITVPARSTRVLAPR